MKRNTCTVCGLILFLALAGCGKKSPEVPVSLRNEEIPPEVRSAIHELNGKVIKSIGAGYDEFVGDFFSKEVRDRKGFENELKNLCLQLQPVIRKTEFVVFSEYYDAVKSSRAPNPVVISDPQEKFVIRVKPLGPEIFVSLLKTPEGEASEYLFALVYMKSNGRWQLYGMNIGTWALGGRTALDWFEESRRFYDRGDLLAAVFRFQLMQMCLRPAPFIQFENEREMLRSTQTMMDDFRVKYPLAFSLQGVASGPEIFSEEPVFAEGEKGFTPLFQYVTKIPLDKTDLLQEEARQMQAVFKERFPGFTEGVKRVAYRAFSELPKDAQEKYPFYGVTVDV